MADLKISELSALAGSNLVAADELAIVDDSASETKKITVSDLIANGVTVISDDTIPGAKILFGAGDIATAALADAAVTTAKVADDAITAAKLGNESTVDLVTTLPGAGGFTGQLALDTDDNKLYIWDGSAWQSLKAAGSVNTVSGSTTGEINIVSSVSGDTVTLSATIDDTTSANQFLAGPTGAAGAVGYRVIDGSDLPVATSSAKGGVVVNGEGLRMDANTIEVDNDVTASSTHHVVTYDAKGLITGGRVLAASDLPIATASAVGGVIPSTGLTVDGSGNLTIDNTVTADTYTKVTVAATGLVTAGSTLAASDLPNHSADLLTSGNIPLARIADNLVTGAKLADYASAKIGETNPTADYIGQLFFNPLTRDLSLWDGNVFQPIGISAGEIVFAGTYNATTNLLSSVTSDGTGAGFVVGQALPAASGTNKNFYVVVDVGGTGTSPAPAVALAPPDFVLSTGTEYKLIDVSETVTAQVASNVGFTPVGTIAANNVQTAIAEVDTEKVAKAGDTMTGDLTLNDANVVFEGATENDNETTLTVVDPTADRTITLPDVTGTVVTTGDTGTVTSAMIVDGTIVNADINASAEIAVSKLANGTARQLLQTASNGSDVEFTSNVDVPGTLDVTGAATLDSTLDVTGLISADGKVSFPLGSASAPSLLPGADTNTGIFSPGADQLAITTAGTQRVTVDSSGNCGIGAASPSHKLDLLVGGGSGGVNVYNNATGAAFYQLATTSRSYKLEAVGSDLRVYDNTGSSEAMRVDSSGRVGIGESSPRVSLDVKSGSSGYSGGLGAGSIASLESNGTAGLQFLSPNDQSNCIYFGDANSNSTGSIQYAHSTNALTLHVNGGTERLRIDSSGRLLVGTTSASGYSSSRMIVTGAGTDATGSSNLVLQIGQANGSVVADEQIGTITFGDTSGYSYANIIAAADLTAGSDSPGRLVFATSADGSSSPTERMRIDSSGELSISGTRSGNGVSDSVLKFNILNSNGDSKKAEIKAIKTADTSSELIFSTTASHTFAERLRIDRSGNVGIGTNVPAGVLGVDGSVYFGNQTASGSTDGVLRIAESTSSVYLQTGTNTSTGSSANLVFSNINAANEWMRIDSSGRLLLGTSSARDKFFGSLALPLQVEGSGTPACSLAITRNDATGDSAKLVLAHARGTAYQILQNNDAIGDISWQAADGAKFGQAANIRAFVDGIPSLNNTPGYIAFGTTSYGSNNPTERMRIDSSGRVLIGKTSPASAIEGIYLDGNIGYGSFTRNGDAGLLINRGTNDGTLVNFLQNDNLEGSISVSGSTVSYNGAHLARWSQLAGGEARTEILRGSVLSNLDEMCEWGEEDNEQLNRMKVSDVEGDKNVSGVFQAWDDDDDSYTNDFYCAMTGDFVIRIAQGTTVARGDLLMSAGDGTAKPQDDDIVRSKTIAKVTSTTVSETYADNSYCVPCVLMAC